MPKIPYKSEESRDDDDDYEIVSFEDFCDKSPGSKTDLLTLNDNINYRLCYESDRATKYIENEDESGSRDVDHVETSLSGPKNISKKKAGSSMPFGRCSTKVGKGSLFGGVIPKTRNEGESSSRDHRPISKVHRHVVTPLAEFPPSQRFEHIHIDVVGPLRLSHDFKFCVTIIDRCTRWPEAVPVQDITAESVAKALYENWIVRFGVPLRITTDRAQNFESALFNTLLKRWGISRIRTTSYHAQSNGKVERLHRTMKAALMARGATTTWVDELPTVLFGLRTALREDNLSPALMTYGATLRIPSDFFVPTQSKIEDAEYVQRLSRC